MFFSNTEDKDKFKEMIADDNIMNDIFDKERKCDSEEISNKSEGKNSYISNNKCENDSYTISIESE